MTFVQALILLVSVAGAVLSYLNLRATKKLAALYEARNQPITYSFDFTTEKESAP